MGKKKIAIVLMSANQLLDFAGPADVFLQANKHSDIYDVTLVSHGGTQMSGAAGIQLNCPNVLDLDSDIDTLLIAGYDGKTNYDKFHTWLETAYDNVRRVGAIGIGAATVAKLNVLHDKRPILNILNENPLLQAQPSGMAGRVSFHSRDGQLYTSGGVSSGIDLALAMVAEDCGRGVAADVARKIIFFYLSRQIYQVQFGNLLAASPMASQLKEWFTERLHEQLDVGRLAEHLNMSPRNFTRVFTSQTGISPAKFIEKCRVEAACSYLDGSGKPLEEIATSCGLGGLVSMRRLFLRHLSITPSEYRRILKLHKNENSN